jgi:hypothetical protein
MKPYFIILAVCMTLTYSVQAQNTPTSKPADTTVKPMTDTSAKPVIDTAALTKKIADSVAAAKPQNCYTKWYDYMQTHGSKPVTDGMQKVVVVVKNGESCHCFMGKVEVAGGKIKAPLYIQQEDGNFKTSSELGKKLDPDFVSSIGADLWKITDGMSALFRTTDQEYGRIFFYEFVSKKPGTAKKEAPSPEDLLKEE